MLSLHTWCNSDNTVLTGLGGDDIKVRAIRGDEYLTKLGSVPAELFIPKAQRSTSC